MNCMLYQNVTSEDICFWGATVLTYLKNRLKLVNDKAYLHKEELKQKLPLGQRKE